MDVHRDGRLGSRADHHRLAGEAVQEQVPFMVAAGDDDEMDASCLPVVSPRCDPDRMLVDIDELRYGHESGSLFTIMSGFA